MRVWLYARLSNDDDAEQNSLENQLRIAEDFALAHGHTVVGSSSDDNRSGMRFDREGLEQLSRAAEAESIDGVIVKDLSRLGRHRVQTALYIEYLLQLGVRVLSATERLDTANDNDDLIIGLHALMNDCYARDIGRKVRAGYRQKQQTGLVIKAPFGYEKDRNSNQIVLHPEAAETVKQIYEWYLSGLGQKESARRLNSLRRKTPAQIQDGRCRKEQQKPYLWTYNSVRNVLREEAYTGVLVNRKSTVQNGKKLPVLQDEQLRHEHYYPILVDRTAWEEAQRMLDEQAAQHRQRCASRLENSTGREEVSTNCIEEETASTSNCRRHRYAGLLQCADCGAPFVPMIRRWNGCERVEYVCKTYMRHNKSVCPSHRIHEEVIDRQVQAFASALREKMLSARQTTIRLQKLCSLKVPAIQNRIEALKQEAAQLEIENDRIMIERMSST